MKLRSYLLLLLQLAAVNLFAQQPTEATIANGKLEGVAQTNGIRTFKGIPFAQPPVGDLRWKEPQPVKDWTGVRKADHFGPRAMQKPVFGDMGFRSDGMSEDCLYLNVWTPSKTANAGLPVMVYFYGGGLVAGDGSEPRYDGESLATKGIVTVTVNYRLGVFGFFSHPELTKESPHQASGNYGYLDQNAALVWVQKNIAAFGGDPKRVTIAGESAGSISVCAQMASPLSKNLIAGAIGESGAPFNPTLFPIPLADGEKNGTTFAGKVGANSLADLRAIPSEKLLDDAYQPGMPPNATVVDGYFLPKMPVDIFNAGEQAQVPLLVGWNSAEIPYQAFMRGQAPTVENYQKLVREAYGTQADEVLRMYPGNNETEVIKSATELASDRFISYSTWKWADLQAKTGGKPVYRYLFSRNRPPMTAKMGNATAGLAGGVIKGNDADANKPKPPVAYDGAAHASEIEYALGNLATNTVYAWTPDDYKVSKTMEDYFANFIKTANPNGGGLPKWAPNTAGSKVQYININVTTKLEPDTTHERYLFLDKQYTK
ncbi:carboxylesterase/lipase family protein [Mucilaginibacter agri]|uniref:Carboxylic ester hydrolase n=1 Tax=Mucilaginibacter agri TaxID=2695265 RepID=A0A965ZH84_9SPHI|nr:carboxylesterase family protein [Mucilaginibacter agri]NCD69707.1 carboxylesterase family protein [Mucilaginibacter agri]